MRLEELPEIEQLAIYQAVYNYVGEKVSTKDPDSLRAAIDESYRELYEQTGSKSFDVKVNGEVVGTYSIRFSKEKQSETQLCFEVEDYVKLAEWFEENCSNQLLTSYAANNLEKFAEWCFTETGEMPEGCEIKKHITPAVDKAYIGGALRVDKESVAYAIHEALPGVAGLIAGEVEDD